MLSFQTQVHFLRRALLSFNRSPYRKAVCIRTSTERPEALEAGDFILAGITTKELLNATDMAIEMKQKGVLGKPCPDYVDETVSMKVVRIIQGYVNVVNKMVWRKISKECENMKILVTGAKGHGGNSPCE